MSISTFAQSVLEINSYAPSLKMKLQLALQLDNDQVRTNKEIKKMNINRDKKKGVKVEHLYLRAARYLDDVKDAWLAKSGYALDNDAKADLIIVLNSEPNTAYCIQVKSTIQQAWEHLELDLVLGGRYEVPGVVVDDAPYAAVIQLHRVTSIPYTNQFSMIMKIAHHHKGTTFPVLAVKYAQEIVSLGLAHYVNFGEDLRFLDDPVIP